MSNRNLYDRDTFTVVMQRIDSLEPETQPVWGKMDAAQMLAHCAEVVEVANGTTKLRNSPWYIKLLKGVIRKQVVGPKPFSRSSPTHPQYVMADPKDFQEQRDRLLAALQTMFDEGAENAEAAVHPLFGRMTADERGWAIYKHLDHHLAQFGV